MKILIIGCGSIGKRHMNNLIRELNQEVIAYDPSKDVLHGIKERNDVKVFSDLNEAYEQKPNAALIASPSAFHLSQALQALKNGVHVFIEKPFTVSLEGIDELISLAREKKSVVLAACNMRFYWSIDLIKKLLNEGSLGKAYSIRMMAGFYLPYWHPTEDYRKSYSARKDLGGGIIFDGIHEIDFARWLMGEIDKVFCLKEKISDLEIDVEDIAEIVLRFKSGAIGEMHLNFLNRTRLRDFQIICEKGVIYWDQTRGEVGVFKGESWTKYPRPFNDNINDMYIKEMKHFIECIEDGKPSINDAENAKRVMEIAIKAKEASEKECWISL